MPPSLPPPRAPPPPPRTPHGGGGGFRPPGRWLTPPPGPSPSPWPPALGARRPCTDILRQASMAVELCSCQHARLHSTVVGSSSAVSWPLGCPLWRAGRRALCAPARFRRQFGGCNEFVWQPSAAQPSAASRLLFCFSRHPVQSFSVSPDPVLLPPPPSTLPPLNAAQCYSRINCSENHRRTGGTLQGGAGYTVS